jgi:integrase
MERNPSEGKTERKRPLEFAKAGSVSVPIYRHKNIIPQRDSLGEIIYGPPDQKGKKQALVKYESFIYTVAYYLGSQRVRKKFSDLAKAKREAELAAVQISNGDQEALKLTGHDRVDYVRSMQVLRGWKVDANLLLAIMDYVEAINRLPPNTSLKEVVDFFVKRHPIGLPRMTVREVVNELIESKTKSGKSDVYVKDLRLRLGQFADAFNMQISLVCGKQIEDFLRAARPGRGEDSPSHFLSGRTQNNFRRLINTLFKFAIKRGYLPRDHDEMGGVELAEEDNGDIEIFTPVELRKLFTACLTPVKEHGKMRDREEMVPYLAIAAFCGLRSAEVARLDWSEVHLTGPERFIEVKASKAKTASRRTVPISDNCAAWLTPFVQESGPVCCYERPDKQCFNYVGPAAQVEWKRNALRHSFISYRLAQIKNVHQVSLEAGNSPQMVFGHYRQLVTETQATEWFDIVPPENWKNTKPKPTDAALNPEPQALGSGAPA